jgi:DNA-binding transcriptional ArsR family regulator
MGTSHTESFSEAHLVLSDLFKALGHPARLAIVQAIAAQKACVCGEFVEITGLSQATVSQHLKELKTAGLIQGSIEGPKTCYCLTSEALEALHSAINHLQRPSDPCC